MTRDLPAATLLLMLFCPAPALAQAPAGPPVAFAPVTAVPIPLQSTSGRFSSLNPPHQFTCSFHEKVIGRVVSTRLILVDGMGCRGQIRDVLMNVELSNPADAVQMVTGRRVAITGTFKSAEEGRGPYYLAVYLIAEKAELVAGDPRAAAAPAFTSYLICQAPELDALAKQLGSELCVQSTIVANLTVTGPALETAARALAKVSPEDAGSDDPNAITCRADPEFSDAHLSAMACARKSYWVWWNAKWRDPQMGPAPP